MGGSTSRFHSSKSNKQVIPSSAPKPSAPSQPKTPQAPPSPVKSRRSSNGRLSEVEIQSRIDTTDENKIMYHAGLKVKYAWLSQRGYYPDEPDKDNQDSYTILPTVFKSDETKPNQIDLAYFGVYDGHGKQGHLCSWFVRDNLHDDMMADDKVSGTTSISALICNKTIYISNVGDSRAILLSVRENDSSLSQRFVLTAKPLSHDQTPYRKDERERVKKYGARILSMDQIEGIEPIHENWGNLVLGDDIDEGGDPPRIWHPKNDYPGCAFTRSLGDRIAEDLGVVADPEIVEHKLTEFDKFVVIASDGVWEFITNQMVADIVAEHRNDPLAACKQIVATAYDLWLQYEVRTDDITIIILSIEEFNQSVSIRSQTETKDKDSSRSTSTTKMALHNSSPAMSFRRNSNTKPNSSHIIENNKNDTGNNNPNNNGGGNNGNDNNSGDQEINVKPVRRTASREKRKNIIQTVEDNVEEDVEELNIESLVCQKNEKDFSTISNYLQKNFLFQHLSVAQMNVVVNVMQPVDVKEGDFVIKQGDPGDRFYIIDYGRFEVRVKTLENNSKSSSEKQDPNDAGEVVYTYESNSELHPGFGELSIMYGKPRAASVISITNGRLWALDRRIFRRVVLRSSDIRKGIIRTLRKVELFKSLTIQQIQRLADLLNENTYKKGEYIIRQGEIGDCFYLILSGICDCTRVLEPGQSETLLVQRKEYEYFGERALLSSEPRAANVIANSDVVKVLYIGKSAFDEVLGSLSDIINEDRLRREALANAILEAPKRLEGIDLRALVSQDNIGPVLLGSFRSPHPNLSVRTFILSEVEKLNLGDSIVHFIEAVRLVTLNQKINSLVPRLHSASKDLNAIHLLFREPLVGDLSTILNLNNRSQSLLCSLEIHTYIASCLVSALETLHNINIIYRNIQPESIYVDNLGRILLMDYRVCKILTIGGKTFTICGASDYLAPEQISQIGHNYSVDLWSLGVMLYEMIMGFHPFSVPQGEIATYTKIASFGTSQFPELKFNDSIPSKSSFLINHLVQVNPEDRLGAGNQGFKKLKRAGYFENVNWSIVPNSPSPLKNIAEIALDDIVKNGIDNNIVKSFSEPFQGSGWEKLIDF